MTDQIEKIEPLDRVSTRQHEYRDLHRRNLIDKRLPFVGAKLLWMAVRLRRSAAVHTSKIAGLGYFPYRNEWALIEVDVWISGFIKPSDRI